MMRSWISVLLLSFALSACVSQGTYDALKASSDAEAQRLRDTVDAQKHSLDELAQQSAAADAARQAAEKKARDEHAARQRVETSLDAAQEDVRRLEAQIRTLEGRTAKLLQDRTSLEASVADMEQALRELQQRKAAADQRVREYRDLLARFRTLIDAGTLQVKIVDGRMVVELSTDVLFPSGKATLSKDGQSAVAEVSAVLATIPEKRYQVEGHTDDRPISTKRYPSNWELASARALTVLRTMVEAGLPAARVSAASYGETRPAQSNDTPEGRTANRRIEIVIVPDLSTLPGFDELETLSKERS